MPTALFLGSIGLFVYLRRRANRHRSGALGSDKQMMPWDGRPPQQTVYSDDYYSRDTLPSGYNSPGSTQPLTLYPNSTSTMASSAMEGQELPRGVLRRGQRVCWPPPAQSGTQAETQPGLLRQAYLKMNLCHDHGL